jgi:hypothetical protein
MNNHVRLIIEPSNLLNLDQLNQDDQLHVVMHNLEKSNVQFNKEKESRYYLHR